VLLVDDIHMLANVIIVDPIRMYLVLRATLFCGVVATVVTHKKEGLY